MNEQIFLVDDEMLLNMSLGNSLSKGGYTTTSFPSAEACLDALEEGDLPDIILMDINFGKNRLSGPEAAKMIHEKYDIPVILHSAYTDKATLESTKEMTKYGYIQKFPGNDQFVQANIETALKLYNSEKLYRELFHNSNDAIFLHDLQDAGMPGNFFEVNDVACKYLGYERDELLQMGPQDIDSAEGSKKMPGVIAELQAKQRVTFETEHVSKDGTVIPVEISSHQFTLNKQTIVISSVRDISERKKFEQELRESEELHRTTLSNISDTVFLTDDDGKIYYVCPNVDVIFGYSEEEVLKKENVEQLFGNLLVESTLLDSENEISNIETSVSDREGVEHNLLVNVKRVSIKGTTRLYTCRDITRLKRKEQDLQKSEQLYRELTNHLQKVREEQNAYIAREIHDDLGQSITALKMNLTVLGKQMDRLEKADMAGDIRETADDMRDILDGIVLKIRSLTTELRPPVLDSMGLVEALKWHINDFQNQFDVSVVLNTDIDELELEHAKSLHIFRIVQEAMTNAVRHGEPSKIEVRISESGDFFHLTVSDNGTGFLAGELDPADSYGLLGMKERAHQIGGSLSVDSSVGKGTTIVLNVPLGEKV